MNILFLSLLAGSLSLSAPFPTTSSDADENWRCCRMDSAKSNFVYCDKRGARKRWGISWVGVDGRRHKEITPARTREQASLLLNQKVREIIEAKVAGVTVEASSITLDEFLKEYLRHAEARKTPRAYGSDVLNSRKLSRAFGRLRLRDIHQGLVQRYVDDRLHEKRKNGTSYRPATINRELMCLSAVFREAVRRQYVQVNPVRGLKQLKENNEMLRYLSDDEEKALLDGCPLPLRAIVICALHTGMRKGEILALRWPDVDFEQRLIKVEQAKTHSKKYIPINETLLALLKELPRPEGCDHVFANESGKPYKEIDANWYRALKRAGLKVRFHDLRHTFASRLVQDGVPLKEVKELLGHKTLKVTERYAHLAPENLRAAVAKLDKHKKDADVSKQ